MTNRKITTRSMIIGGEFFGSVLFCSFRLSHITEHPGQDMERLASLCSLREPFTGST